MLKNQIRVQYFSNYKTFKKNISLTDDERNAIQNSIIALIQGLEYTEKINVLSKISIESRLAKEDYEIRLNHSILSDFLSFFSQSFITFFSMLIGAIIGFSGSIISNMLQELNLKDFNSYIIIAKTVVSSFANNILDYKMYFLIFISISLFLPLYILVSMRKREFKYYIFRLSYQEYYSQYLLHKLSNLLKQDKH